MFCILFPLQNGQGLLLTDFQTTSLILAFWNHAFQVPDSAHIFYSKRHKNISWEKYILKNDNGALGRFFTCCLKKAILYQAWAGVQDIMENSPWDVRNYSELEKNDKTQKLLLTSFAHRIGCQRKMYVPFTVWLRHSANSVLSAVILRILWHDFFF